MPAAFRCSAAPIAAMRCMKASLTCGFGKLADGALQGGDAGVFGGQIGIGGDAALHRQGCGGIELAIDQRMDHEGHAGLVLGQSIVVRTHRALPRSEISWARALASRDMTVPIGTSSISDISR